MGGLQGAEGLRQPALVQVELAEHVPGACVLGVPRHGLLQNLAGPGLLSEPRGQDQPEVDVGADVLRLPVDGPLQGDLRLRVPAPAVEVLPGLAIAGGAPVRSSGVGSGRRRGRRGRRPVDGGRGRCPGGRAGGRLQPAAALAKPPVPLSSLRDHPLPEAGGPEDDEAVHFRCRPEAEEQAGIVTGLEAVAPVHLPHLPAGRRPELDPGPDPLRVAGLGGQLQSEPAAAAAALVAQQGRPAVEVDEQDVRVPVVVVIGHRGGAAHPFGLPVPPGLGADLLEPAPDVPVEEVALRVAKTGGQLPAAGGRRARWRRTGRASRRCRSRGRRCSIPGRAEPLRPARPRGWRRRRSRLPGWRRGC